jgi:multiple sugar transport system ATP-binding protein
MSALNIVNLSKRCGTLDVLKDINLNIQSGEFIVLVGPSGCGKSTLLSIIAGLEKVSGGNIEIAGKLVTDVSAKDRDIAMVFQSYALYPTMTVRENITLGMRCRGVPLPEQKKALTDTSKLLQIDHLLDRKPAQLSGGQRQRVAMGRALVRDPILFLFDEPLSNLDAQLRVEMRMEIKRLHSRLNATIVYVTHDQVEAMTLASRVAVMHKGKVQQFADPDTIYEKPANLFVARFMGSPPMNTIPARLDGVFVDIVSTNAKPVRLALPSIAGISAHIGTDVILGIRPECITEPQDQVQLAARRIARGLLRGDRANVERMMSLQVPGRIRLPEQLSSSKPKIPTASSIVAVRGRGRFLRMEFASCATPQAVPQRIS